MKPNLSDIDETRYGSLFKPLRVTDSALRFVDRLKKQVELLAGSLTVQELQKAKLLWELNIQQKHYVDTIYKVKHGKKSDLKSQLNLQLNQSGLLWYHGRFENAELTQAAKCPKLIFKDSYFTRLVVKDMHSWVLHSGVSQTLAKVWQEYWVPCGCAVIKKLMKNCGVCRWTEGAPYPMTWMSHLPKKHVLRSQPFEYTDVNYFGPLYVKEFPKVTSWEMCRSACLLVLLWEPSTLIYVHWRIYTLSLSICGQTWNSRLIISNNAQQFKAAQTVLTKAWKDVVTDERIQNFSAK